MLASLFLAQVPGGGYISIWKAALVVVVLLAWGRLLTWVDKDQVAARLARVPLNVAWLGGMVLAFALFFLLPVNFWIAFAVLVVIMLIEVGVYLILRHQRVGLHDLGQQFNDWIKSFTVKKSVKELPNQVTVVQKNGQPLPPPLAESPDQAAYVAIQEAFTEPLQKGAEHIVLSPSESGLGVRYSVDGVFYRGATVDRAAGAQAVTMLKEAVGLDTENRRKPQRANIRLAFDGRRREFRMDTAGTTAGESVQLLSDPKKRHDFTIDKLGFTPRQLEIVRKTVTGKVGIVLVAAPKEQGLTSIIYGLINAHDAFLEHIHTIEREPDVELTGITQNKMPKGAPPAEEAKQVDWVISQEPDVIVIPQLEDPRSAQHLIDHAKAGRMAYIGLRAGSTADALAQWRRLVGDDRAAMEHLVLVIAGRIVRKLCMACKQAYVPDPATLQRLGMSPEKVPQLFQARTEPLRDQKGNPMVCDFCLDMRFKGRMGVFEILQVDDAMKQAVVSGGGSEKQLRAAFRQQKGKYLQEEALGLVEQGETSVQEVLRVLKGGSGEAPAEPGAEAAPRPAAPARRSSAAAPKQSR